MLKIYRIKTTSRKSSIRHEALEFAWLVEVLTIKGWVNAGRSFFGFSEEYARQRAYEQLCSRRQEFILIGKKPKLVCYYKSGKAVEDWKISLITPTKLTREIIDTRTEYTFVSIKPCIGFIVYRTIMALNEVEAYKRLTPPNITDRKFLA